MVIEATHPGSGRARVQSGPIGCGAVFLLKRRIPPRNSRRGKRELKGEAGSPSPVEIPDITFGGVRSLERPVPTGRGEWRCWY